MPKTKFIFAFLFLTLLSGMYINSTTFFRLKLADYYMRTQDYDKVISVYKKIVRKETSSSRYQTLDVKTISDIYFTLAGLLVTRNKFAESVQMLKRIIEINPAYKMGSFPDLSAPEYYSKFASLLLRWNLKDMAIEQSQKAVEVEPDNPSGYYQLALIYQRQGMEEKSIAQFEKAAELADKCISQSMDNLPAYLGDIYYDLGLRLERDGDIEKAKDCYEKAIGLDGNRIIGAYYCLKSLYKKQDKFEDIESIETKLLNLKPEYKVNHKFSDGLILLGYSLNEREFELFNGCKITFFWVFLAKKSKCKEVPQALRPLSGQASKRPDCPKTLKQLRAQKPLQGSRPHQLGARRPLLKMPRPFQWQSHLAE